MTQSPPSPVEEKIMEVFEMKKKLFAKLIGPSLIVLIGLGLLLYPKFTDMQYGQFQEALDTSTPIAQADENVTEEIKPLPKEAVARLTIPKINLETFVLEGTSLGILKKGTGHFEETPLPGESGNSAIAGHRTMHGHPFRHLDKLKNGNKILVQVKSEIFVYKVVEVKIIKPTNLSVIDQTESKRLTLTTCHPVGSARERLIVVAEIDEE